MARRHPFSFFSKSTKRTSAHTCFRPTLESLESRNLLTAVGFSAGELAIDIDDGSSAELSASGGQVYLNGSPIAGPVMATDVEHIRISATGDFANTISLQNVTVADFPSLQDTRINAGGGDDTVIGSEVDDLILGGAGNDHISGGAGNDTLEGDGRIAVTVTNLAPADGLIVAPVFLATTDGTYDYFDAGSPASASVESMAEDGDISGRIASALASGNVSQALGTGGPVLPGTSTTLEFDVSAADALSQYLTYGAMVVPSNDAFIGNDNPHAIDLLDAHGNVISRTGSNTYLVTGSDVWDAGTEVNDEIPMNTAALGQMTPNTGTTEAAVIMHHQGFMGAHNLGGPLGNILTAFPGADFTAPGVNVLSIEVTELSGNDVLMGGDGDDTLRGGDGDDLLVGGAGGDQLYGGKGDDSLEGDGRVAVTVTNLAPADGLIVAPVFAATTDGTYDYFNAGSPASPTVESMAEDGDVSGRIASAVSSGKVSQALSTGVPVLPGTSATLEFDVTAHNPLSQYLSYGAMVVPSNDAFIGNDNPHAIDLLDHNGNVISRTGADAIIVKGSDVWDAGTEVNDEIPMNTAALGQMTPNTGTSEGGVIMHHQGFMGSHNLGGSLGNILTAFPGADFTAPGVNVLSIEITELAGNDVLVGAEGNDEIRGGGGDDHVIWNNGDGSDLVEGGAGYDQQFVNGSEAGSDRFRFDQHGDHLKVRRTNLGAFSITAGAIEALHLDTGGGNDSVVAGNLRRVSDLALLSIQAGDGRDYINISRAGYLHTQLSGGEGNDVIFGSQGIDEILGGAGNDVLLGGRGNDMISGDAGNDIIFGGFGNDVLSGGDGRDIIFGGFGDDEIEGGAGFDLLFGGFGRDIVHQ